MTGKVLFYVQHLLGIGHVVRASRIARALDAAGFDVCVAYGGRPLDDIDWGAVKVFELPTVSAGPDGFACLVQKDGTMVGNDFKVQRTAKLVSLFQEYNPDVLLIEAYPFARRIMRFELLPLLKAAHARTTRPVVLSSIRDILQEGRKTARITETVNLVETFFDAVLVHGDEAFAPLSLSFPATAEISARIHYTGLIAPDIGTYPQAVNHDVIVSAGGGAAGAELLEAAASAANLSNNGLQHWLFLSGPNLDQTTFDELRAKLPDGAVLQRFHRDLCTLMRSAKISISQAGYNTVADILSARCRSVLVPFARDGETEQTRRAELLEKQNRAIVVAERHLSGPAITDAINLALTQTLSSKPSEINLNGSTGSARIISRILKNFRR